MILTLRNSLERKSAWRTGSGKRYLAHRSTSSVAVSSDTRCPIDTKMGLGADAVLRTAFPLRCLCQGWHHMTSSTVPYSA